MLRRLLLGAFGIAWFAACDTSPLDAPKPGDIGRPCKRSADCASGQCVPRIGETITDANDGVCSQTCSGNGDCVAGWSCLSMSGVDVCQCRRANDVCDGLDNDCNGVVDDGLCTCKNTICGDACIDTTSDSTNCGACGVRCEGTTTCLGGKCGCAPGLVACDAVCVDLQKSAANCGACGKSCEAGACVAGVCSCAAAPHEPCEIKNDDHLCGDDGRCHAVTVGGPTRLTYELTAGATYLFAAYSVVSVAPDDTIDKTRLDGKPGGERLNVGSRGAVPRVATDGDDFAYFLRKDATNPIVEPSQIVGCAAGVCGAPLVTDVEAPGLRLFGGKVYWVEGGNLRRCALAGCGGSPEDLAPVPSGTVGRIVADATGVYGAFGDAIHRWTEASGTFTKLIDVNGPNLLATDDTTLYVTTGSAIVSCPKSACTSAMPFATTTAPDGLGVRGTAVHWTSAKSLYRCPKASGCVPQRITSSSPLGADDENTIFTVESPIAGYHAVRRLSK